MGKGALHNRLARAEAAASGAETGDRPTCAELWRYQLVYSAYRAAEAYHRRAAQGETEPKRLDGSPGYDLYWLYEHRDELRTRADAEAASDDVLLEALGCGNVESWGWLGFMVRDLCWFALLAYNWGLPSINGPYGGAAGPPAKEAERRAFAARQFCDLMRARGVDPLADVREQAEAIKKKYELSEGAFTKLLREHDEWAYFVYTCESVGVRPGSAGEAGRVQYTGDARAEFLAEVRRAQLPAK